MKPRSCTHLFLAFNALALQGFGGVMAVAHRELVERRQWLSNEQYLQEVALAQALPGPNVCNLALMLGDRHFGWRGAVAALTGLMLVPMLLLLGLVLLYGNSAGHPVVDAALRGMGAVVGGAVAGTAFKLTIALKGHPMGTALAVTLTGLTLLALAVAHWPMAAVLAGFGTLGVALTWRRLRHAGAS